MQRARAPSCPCLLPMIPSLRCGTQDAASLTTFGQGDAKIMVLLSKEKMTLIMVLKWPLLRSHFAIYRLQSGHPNIIILEPFLR